MTSRQEMYLEEIETLKELINEIKYVRESVICGDAKSVLDSCVENINNTIKEMKEKI